MPTTKTPTKIPTKIPTKASSKKRASRFNKFGYGALVIYAVGMMLVAGSVYGLSLTNLLLKLNATERARDAARTGRMVFATPDRMGCRSYRFDNQTTELGQETVSDCDEQRAPDLRPPTGSGSFGAARDSFNNR